MDQWIYVAVDWTCNRMSDANAETLYADWCTTAEDRHALYYIILFLCAGAALAFVGGIVKALKERRAQMPSNKNSEGTKGS